MSIFDVSANAETTAVSSGGKEWHVKHLTALDRDRFELQWMNYRKAQGDSVQGIRAFVTVFCLCDKDGNHLHPSGNGDKASGEFLKAVAHANSLSSEFISPLSDVAFRVNKLTKQDVEELEGN